MAIFLTFLTILAAGSSLGFFLVVIYYWRREELAMELTTVAEEVQPSQSAQDIAWRIATLEEQIGELQIQILFRHAKLRLVLAVALVQRNGGIVLVRLRSHVFTGRWGFPAGYVEDDHPDASKRKADYEIEKYLPGARVEYLAPLTEEKMPLVITYGGEVPVEVRVHQYALVEPLTLNQDQVLVLRPEEIERLDHVNPLVFDVLGYHLQRLFSDDFEEKMERIKQSERSKIFSFEQFLKESSAV